MPNKSALTAGRAAPRGGWRAALATLITLLLALAAAPAPAAERWSTLTELSFQHLTQEQGLPNEIATAVAEDGEGFIWVGTLVGVARWDGYRFRVYRGDPRTPGALPDNVVQTLHGDTAGRLWVGTSAAGIARFDRENERFVSYPVGPNGLSHVSVRSIVDDGSGGLWVATDGGLDHLDPASGSIRHAPPVAEGSATAAGGGVNVLLRDRRGALWAGTPHGLFRRDALAGRFVPVELLAGAQPQPQPQSLEEDSAGRIWVGTQQQGAFVIDGAGAPARPVQESGIAGAASALATQSVTTITEVRRGEVWIGTAAQGIVAVDVASGETRRVRNLPTLPQSLSDNAVRSLYRDRAGLVWAAGSRGLNRHDPRQSAILTMYALPSSAPAARASTEVSWVLPAPDGRIWIGTHRNGVEIIDPERGVVGALRPDATRPESALPDDSVLALEHAADGSVFIGTKRGLYRASADGRSVARVRVDGRDPKASTWALLVDGGTLWFGGQSDGLWRLDLKTGHAAPAFTEPTEYLSDERIIVLARGSAGTLWVGTRYGLNRFDPARGTVERITPDPAAPDGLSAGFVTALYTDRAQRLWVGTYGGGINLLADTGGAPRFRHLASAHGLPDDNVNAVLEDDAGRLWASTDNGLAMIDPASLAVRSLRRAEGVVFPTYWTGSAARTDQGELLFGGAGGMTIVRPHKLQPWSYRPPVVVTEIQVGGKRLLAGRVGAGAKATERMLVVPADANSLAVEFAAIDYSAPERNRYAYKLDGFDAGWIETDASRRLAAYTNLPPGGYRLLLRGTNRDGAWSDYPLALAVHVLPAWHQTLWFRAAALAAVFVLIAALVSWRTRLLRLRQAELERKVGERTAELEAMSRALAEKSRILERTAITDPLTGLHNRRFLTEHIDSEIAASLRRAAEPGAASRTPVDTDNVFFLVDVDHFKRVNDRWGHAAGDAVLVQFGRRVQAVLRESDVLVRWGGEEFLAVARDTDRARAEELAERMRAVVAEAPFVADDGRLIAVTCSIGFATVPFLFDQPRALGWTDVVQVADLALLAAKRVGRNAWVGVDAGAAARPPGLRERLLTAPVLALRDGEIVLASNRPLDSVVAALSTSEGDGTRAVEAMLRGGD